MTTATASIWIDDDEAVIRAALDDGHALLDRLIRRHGETAAALALRAVDGVRQDTTVQVDGTDGARLRFGRAYVSVTHRPDRLVDVADDLRTSRPRR